MFNLGLKCAYDPAQLYNRIKYQPDLIEIQLFEQDLFGANRTELENTISMLKSLNIEVYLHHPIKFQGEKLDIIHNDPTMYHFYHLTTRILSEICNHYHIKCVIHPHYSGTPSSTIAEDTKKEMIKEISEILDYSENVFVWENTIEGLFSSQNYNWFKDIVQPLNLPIVYDISHAFISFRGDNDLLMKELNQMSDYIKYFHVVDSLGQQHDSLSLGKGKVNWERVLPYIKGKPYIYEIGLKDFTDGTEMVESHNYLVALEKRLSKENALL